MMRCLWLTVTIAVIAAPAAAESPLAGSPGRDGTLAVVENRCPTFSWGLLPGTAKWRLAVYRVETAAAAPDAGELVLAERLPGSFHSWTPSLERCLDRGRTYAWTVGAESRKGEVKWSEPRLFRVPERSPMEIDEALALVRRHLEESSTGATKGPVQASTAPPPAIRRPDAAVAAAAASRAPLPLPAMKLDGNVHMEGFRPIIRLENDFSTPQVWDMTSTEFGFFLVDDTGGGGTPFSVLNGAPTGMLQVQGSGISLLGSIHCTDCVGSGDIAANAVGGAQIADGTLTGTDIADGSIFSADIVDGSVTTVDIANETIQTSDIENDTILGVDIAPSTIGASKLADDSVGSAQMAQIQAVAVECDGNCDDSNLRLICETLSPPPYVPIAVNCAHINNSIPLGTDNCIGGNNDCSDGIVLDSILPLDRWCSDGAGIDALVFCLRQGSG